MSEWESKKLRELAIPKGISYGIVQPGQHDSAGVPIVRVSDLESGRVNVSQPLRVSPTIEENYLRTRLEGGELLISLVGTLGRVAIVPADLKGWNVARAVGVVRLQHPEDAAWLKVCLEQPELQHAISSRANTTVQHTFNLADLQELNIPFPAQKVRQRVLDLITPLNDKIELNRQMNCTLEQMARALFQSWFVDFDPVRAKMRGEAPEGMDTATAALFPNELVEVDGREVPKGWNYQRAESFAQITIGKTPPRQETEWFSKDSDDVTWVSIRDMSGHDVYISKSAECLTQEAVSRFNVKTVAARSVLLSFKLTIGRVRIAARNLTTNEAIAHFSFGDLSFKANYVYYNLSCYDYSALGSTSSIATAVNSKIIKGMPFLIPTEAIVKAFDEAVSSIMAQVENLQNESAHLAQLRDSLLPRLLSGEVDVSEWAAALEAQA